MPHNLPLYKWAQPRRDVRRRVQAPLSPHRWYSRSVSRCRMPTSLSRYRSPPTRHGAQGRVRAPLSPHRWYSHSVSRCRMPHNLPLYKWAQPRRDVRGHVRECLFCRRYKRIRNESSCRSYIPARCRWARSRSLHNRVQARSIFPRPFLSRRRRRICV